jgi:hypothetical protein
VEWLADLFPLLGVVEQEALAADILAHALHASITTFEGKSVDVGVEPVFKEYAGADPLAYVISLNMKRRHLDESQRAMVAAKIATLKHGGDRSKSPIGDLTAVSQAQAAAMLNVGKRSVERAQEVLDSGDHEMITAVEHGDLAVSAAARAVRGPSTPLPGQPKSWPISWAAAPSGLNSVTWESDTFQAGPKRLRLLPFKSYMSTGPPSQMTGQPNVDATLFFMFMLFLLLNVRDDMSRTISAMITYKCETDANIRPCILRVVGSRPIHHLGIASSSIPKTHPRPLDLLSYHNLS